MQDPSFLSHQKRLGKKTNRSNFETLFGIKKIPSPNQIRNILDNASPKELNGLFFPCIFCDNIYHALYM